LVREVGFQGVILSLALILVVKFLGRGGKSNGTW
jgi:hypothetical protein